MPAEPAAAARASRPLPRGEGGAAQPRFALNWRSAGRPAAPTAAGSSWSLETGHGVKYAYHIGSLSGAAGVGHAAAFILPRGGRPVA